MWVIAQTSENDCSTIENAFQPDDFMRTSFQVAIDNVWDEWTAEQQADFASTKQQIYDIPAVGGGDVQDKLRKAVQLLDGYAPDGSAAKNLLLSVPMYTFNIDFTNMCTFLNCAIVRGFLAGAKKDCGWITTTTTTTPAPVCSDPASSNQVSLVLFDDELTRYSAGFNSIGSCTCDVGKNSLWTSGPDMDDIYSWPGYAIMTESCPDLCLIDEAGTECKPSGADPRGDVYLLPYCSKGKCHMYALILDEQITCGSKNYSYESQLAPEGSPVWFKPLDPDASPQVYIHVTAFTCKGCADIRSSNCIKPFTGTSPTATSTTTATSAMTTSAATAPAAGCADIESLVQADSANNTMLTTALNAAWNGWSRSDKANFAAYKKRIENAVYNPSPDWDNGIKTEQVSRSLDGYAPDGSAAKGLILAIQIAGWGSLCDYLNCAIRGWYMLGPEKNCEAFTTTKSATTSTSCAYPSNSSQVGLVVFDGEPRGGSTGEIGSCGCDVGKKAFYVSGPSSYPFAAEYATFIEFPKQKDDCANFCIIDEAGDECRFSNASAEMTIRFLPYCVRGKCHMYVFLTLSYDDTGSDGLICGSRNFTQRDGWITDGSELRPLDPDTSPQVG